MAKQKVLFLCTHNSCRSQMAEGLLRHFGKKRFEAYSAGTDPTELNPHASKVMAEVGIDISAHLSKSADEFIGQEFGYVITVCGGARDACPAFPGAADQIHWDIPDPAEAEGTEEDVLATFRRVRDILVDKIKSFASE
ncbi:MAG: arsenate reductase ArsC [Planctomycetia bacterium]|nr:arsenate reductase ArsC [Planctomycetia bacterium]